MLHGDYCDCIPVAADPARHTETTHNNPYQRRSETPDRDGDSCSTSLRRSTNDTAGRRVEPRPCRIPPRRVRCRCGRTRPTLSPSSASRRVGRRTRRSQTIVPTRYPRTPLVTRIERTYAKPTSTFRRGASGRVPGRTCTGDRFGVIFERRRSVPRPRSSRRMSVPIGRNEPSASHLRHGPELGAVT